MIGALIRKDFSLLRLYLRSMVGALIACFVASAILIFSAAREGIEPFKSCGMFFMVAAILATGVSLGFIVVVIFSSLLSGSVITLERSDRSSQFLACLPPSRLRNYLSKLIVIASVVLLTLSILLFAWFAANQLLHAADSVSSSRDARTLPDPNSPLLFVAMSVAMAHAWDEAILHPLFATLSSMIGGSLLASLWSKSNAVPTLCGVLTPIAIVLAIVRVKVVWNIELPEEEWLIVFSQVASGVGLFCIVVSGCAYVFQREF
jgi:hypothetical protein